MVMPLTLCGVGHGHNRPLTVKFVTKYTQITIDLIYYRGKVPNSMAYYSMFHWMLVIW